MPGPRERMQRHLVPHAYVLTADERAANLRGWEAMMEA